MTTFSCIAKLFPHAIGTLAIMVLNALEGIWRHQDVLRYLQYTQPVWLDHQNPKINVDPVSKHQTYCLSSNPTSGYSKVPNFAPQKTIIFQAPFIGSYCTGFVSSWWMNILHQHALLLSLSETNDPVRSSSKISTLEGHQVEVVVALLPVKAAPCTLSPTRQGENFPTAHCLKSYVAVRGCIACILLLSN